MGVDLDPTAVAWFVAGLLALLAAATIGSVRTGTSKRERDGAVPPVKEDRP